MQQVCIWLYLTGQTGTGLYHLERTVILSQLIHITTENTWRKS